MQAKLKIMTNEDRAKNKSPLKIAIFGPHNAKKTRCLMKLSQKTLCIDIDGGMKSVEPRDNEPGWAGNSVKIDTWEDARDIACLLRGPNPVLLPNQPYSKAHYDRIRREYASELKGLECECIFIDGLTAASRKCLEWCQSQPESFSSKGVLDTRAMYGLLAREMMAWISRFQDIPDKNIILTCSIMEKQDEHKKWYWAIQCEGDKTGKEVCSMFDEVLCMPPMEKGSKGDNVFYTNLMNPLGFPAKDRSGALKQVEPDNLDLIFEKINGKGNIQDPEPDTPWDDVTLQSLESQITSFNSQEELETFANYLKQNNSKLEKLLSSEELERLRDLWKMQYAFLKEEVA